MLFSFWSLEFCPCVPCVTSSHVCASHCFRIKSVSLSHVSCFTLTVLCAMLGFSVLLPLVSLYVISPSCALLLCLIPLLSVCVFKPFVFFCLLLDCLCIIHCISPGPRFYVSRLRSLVSLYLFLGFPHFFKSFSPLLLFVFCLAVIKAHFQFKSITDCVCIWVQTLHTRCDKHGLQSHKHFFYVV